ncbi:threonine/serine exporter family protein [Melissococcus plutonius]|uniref:Membrane protein n=1 Tax=Melissococcus plutonius (strain ATCC 35311 / DSM 29964 / CIP 104052 / LMG 20360 / NCIMB 702443) TaxID=940190 RepID=F3YB71_MELPT|nr:threonine/serine exporter family protein [Melissococcus plutonius]AIM25167.1 putative membrane protein [Melissococcus plutonius S1]KMT25426.1 putative membrane protein [Melissococcus plutonius]KMT25466.1 putative membrane protein [Melissococcus plutonius]KMT26330.1 putative membrane protein [Melissococcus plutonius]KMT29072.1 putative membrane protein [Melissococcus plutonius]
MTIILIEITFSFIASVAFAIMVNVPRRSLIGCGLTGMAGWLVYWYLKQLGVNAVISALAGSIIVALLSDFFSKYYKLPVTIFNIPGMFALVPGYLSYQTVRNLVTGNYQIAIHAATQAFMVGGAIVLGLFLSEVFNHNIRNFKQKKEKDKKNLHKKKKF